MKQHEDIIENHDQTHQTSKNEYIGKFTNKSDCELIHREVKVEPKEILNDLIINRDYLIKKQYHKEDKKYAGNPFITSSLQQASQGELGLSVKATMNIAQKLYENGKITYMRTDSTNISSDFQGLL